MMKDRFVFNKYIKTCFFISLLTICGCGLRGINLKDIAENRFKITANVENTPLREVGSIVVCRSKQCAPAKLSMSSQYIFNSLLHLFENNNHKKMLVCQANPSSRTCLENYITLPIKVGITPAYMYIDSVKITDVIINKGTNTLNLILNYNVTYNGQTPDCTPAESVLYVRNINHILLEDPGYNCKMTTVGTTNIKTIFVIDYIDLDYGYKNRTAIRDMGFLGTYMDLLLLPNKLLLAMLDPHPNTEFRFQDQINYLKKELNKQNISESAKRDIKKTIEEIEKEIKKYTDAKQKGFEFTNAIAQMSLAMCGGDFRGFLAHGNADDFDKLVTLSELNK